MRLASRSPSPTPRPFQLGALGGRLPAPQIGLPQAMRGSGQRSNGYPWGNSFQASPPPRVSSAVASGWGVSPGSMDPSGGVRQRSVSPSPRIGLQKTNVTASPRPPGSAGNRCGASSPSPAPRPIWRQLSTPQLQAPSPVLGGVGPPSPIYGGAAGSPMVQSVIPSSVTSSPAMRSRSMGPTSETPIYSGQRLGSGRSALDGSAGGSKSSSQNSPMQQSRQRQQLQRVNGVYRTAQTSQSPVRAPSQGTQSNQGQASNRVGSRGRSPKPYQPASQQGAVLVQSGEAAGYQSNGSGRGGNPLPAPIWAKPQSAFSGRLSQQSVERSGSSNSAYQPAGHRHAQVGTPPGESSSSQRSSSLRQHSASRQQVTSQEGATNGASSDRDSQQVNGNTQGHLDVAQVMERLSLPEDMVIKHQDLKFEAVLWDGKFSRLYRGRKKDMPVAIKELQRWRANADLLSDLVDEVATLRGLNHEYIVRLIGVCLDTQVCLVTEYIDGLTCDYWLHTKKLRFSEREALQMGCQLTDAIAYLHGLTPQRLHRDIKPLNILVIFYNNAEVNIKVIDFGLSVEVPDGCIPNSHFKGLNGSPLYLPPEAFDPEGSTASALDVWALGCTAGEIFTNRRPYEGARQLTELVTIVRAMRQPPFHGIAFSNTNPKLERIVRSCFEFEAMNRPNVRQLHIGFKEALQELGSQ